MSKRKTTLPGSTGSKVNIADIFEQHGLAFKPGELSEREKMLIAYGVALFSEHQFSIRMLSDDMSKHGITEKQLKELHEVVENMQHSIAFLKERGK